MSVMEHSHLLTPGWPDGGTPCEQAPGLVSLVGAGPGDPELLTLKAVKALQAAKLVPVRPPGEPGRAGLSAARRRPRVCGQGIFAPHPCPRKRSSNSWSGLARSGRAVLRLKGGDGYIFGRGGEEAQALAAEGIPFTVVPGLTAAQGAAASVGIPLTHRDHACSLVLTTGHLRDNKGLDMDWELLARPRQTVVLYMGVNNLPQICRQLIAHGLPGDTPAALVEKATLPEERCITGTLAELPQLAVAHGVKPPALIMVGGVVSLRAQLMPGVRADRSFHAAAPALA